MHIQQAPETCHDAGAWQALRQFVATLDSPPRRPCGSCSQPVQPGVYCTRPCAEAALALSSEPGRYPIEAGVLPLVFALARLAHVKPCWSCEGHNDANGRLWKMPQVWFYACSPTCARLINLFLWEMRAAGFTGHEWRVTLSAFSEFDCDMYVIEPAIRPGVCSLQGLQRDLAVLGQWIEAGVTAVAYRNLLSRTAAAHIN